MNKVLILNNDNSPISVMTFERGFRLAYKGKASVVSYVEGKPIMCTIHDDDYLGLIDICPTLLTDNGKGFKRPTILRLNKYVFMPFKKVTLSRYNIYRRDDYTCVYCDSVKDLTLDHVKPRCKGGKNTWENLVTCCATCNTAKGHKPLDVFLKEEGLIMRHKPYRPTYMEFLSNHKSIMEDWRPYVYV